LCIGSLLRLALQYCTLFSPTTVALPQESPSSQLDLPECAVSCRFFWTIDDLFPPDPEAGRKRALELRERIGRGDDSSATKLELALALEEGEQREESLALLDDLIPRLAEEVAGRPDALQAELEYGRALYARGWIDQAMPRLYHVLQTEPSEWRAAEDIAEAVLVSTLLPAAQTGDPSHWDRNSVLAALQSRFPDSFLKNAFRSSAEAAPPRAAASIWMGLAYFSLLSTPAQGEKGIDQAVGPFLDAANRCLLLAPQCKKIRVSAAWLHLLRILFRSELATDSHAPFPILRSATSDDQKKIEASHAELMSIADADPECAEALGALALFESMFRDDMTRATEFAQRALATKSRWASPLEMILVEACLRQDWKRCDEIGSVLATGCDTARTHRLLGRVSGYRRDLARSEQEYRRATELDPEDGDAWLALSVLARARSEPEDVVSDLLLKAVSARSKVHQQLIVENVRSYLGTLDSESDRGTGASATQLFAYGRFAAAAGRKDVAIARLTAAVDAAQAENRPDLEAEALEELSSSYRDLGEWSKARAPAERAIELDVKAGKPEAASPVLDELAVIHDHEGRTREAQRCREQALSICPSRTTLAWRSAVLLLAAGCYSTHEFDRCESLCFELLSSNQESTTDEKVPPDVEMAHLLVDLCKAARTEEPARSKEIERLCIRAETRQDEPTVMLLSAVLSEDAVRRGDFLHAAVWLKRRESLSDEASGRASSLLSDAMLYSEARQPQTALDFLEKAAAAIATIPDRVLSERERLDVRDRWAGIPLLATRLACRDVFGDAAVDPARAFALVDAMTARTLLEGMQERLAGARSEVDERLASRRLELNRRIDELRVRARTAPAGENEIGKELARLQSELDADETRARSMNARLSQISDVGHVQLQDLQRTLAQDEAVLVYVTGNPDSFAWSITRDRVAVRRIAGEDKLALEVRRLTEALAGAPAGSQDYVAPARRLDQLLIDPVLQGTSAPKRLLIVPDGALAFVPFDVLLTSDPPKKETPARELPFLVRRCSVRCAPSCTSLVSLGQAASPPEPSRKDVLLLADALYEAAGAASVAQAGPPADRAAVVGSGRLQRLRETREEARAIAESLLAADEGPLFVQLRDLPRSGAVHARRFDLLVGADASQDVFRRDLRAYRIVHCAVHGHFDTECPTFSGIVVSPGSGKYDDGFVSVADLGLLELDADVVFLSACDTARGDLIASEGPRSAVRSLLLSGARSVIGTAWEVDDAAAVVIATEFYKNLFQGGSVEEALRAAKIAALDQRLVTRGAQPLDAKSGTSDPGYSSPHFWAPYVLWGGAAATAK
jgi:CHAT domain-containing protein/tetratricopeptide (TPR) repeat protein